MVILLSVAIAPSFALFSYFYLRREFSREPSRLLLYCFVYGAILTFPILFIQYVFAEEQVFSVPYAQLVLFPGILEEFFKWLVLLITVFRHIEFDDPYDGILYGVSVSLGFATVENLLYLIEYGLDAAFLRAFFPVSSHALFGVVMGYYLGKAKFTSQKIRIIFLVMALAAPVALHDLYNSILFIENHYMPLMIPFMLFLWWFALRKVKRAHHVTLTQFQERPPINF